MTYLRRSFLLGVFGLYGCAARVSDEAPPAGATGSELVCTSGERPTAPSAPTTACLEERLGEGGIVVGTTRRTTAIVDGVEVVSEETFDAAGVLSKRVIRKSRGSRVIFESTEHPLLSADDSLPYTYGQAATFSIAYDYDGGGRLLRKAYDRAIDGVVDGDELTTYHATGEIAERTTLADGALARRARFDALGNPLSELEAGDYGRRWSYDAAGLLVREERIAAGVLVQRSEWTMRAQKTPLRQVIFDVSANGTEVKVAEATWTYDASGVLTALDGWQTISGARRVKHTELDARGRATLFVEENEEPTCRRYQQVSEYRDGDEPVQQTTTCDGRPFQRLRTTFDADGRKIRVERGFYGNPRSVTEDVSTYAYDACGRLVSSEATHNGSLQRREVFTFDARGRMSRIDLTEQTGATSTSLIVYDASGRIVAMDGKRWSYDAAGRITMIESENGRLGEDKRTRILATRFAHVCGT